MVRFMYIILVLLLGLGLSGTAIAAGDRSVSFSAEESIEKETSGDRATKHVYAHTFVRDIYTADQHRGETWRSFFPSGTINFNVSWHNQYSGYAYILYLVMDAGGHLLDILPSSTKWVNSDSNQYWSMNCSNCLSSGTYTYNVLIVAPSSNAFSPNGYTVVVE